MTTDWYTLTVNRVRLLKWEAVADTGTTLYYFSYFTKRGTTKKLKKFMSNMEEIMTFLVRLEEEV